MKSLAFLLTGFLLGALAAPALAAGPASDEFDSPYLSFIWTVTDPSAPNSYLSLTERPGFLRMVATVLNGGGDYCGCDNYNAPRMVQTCGGDWTLEVRMEFAPAFNYQGAGIFIPNTLNPDSASWRMAERAYYPDGGGQVVRCIGGYVPYTGTTTFFRIVKQADTLWGYWSPDGNTWNFNGKNLAIPTALGLFAVCHDWNGGQTSSSVADFDYFRISGATAVPLAPPSRPRLSLAGLRPNPAPGPLTAAFSLASGADATLELLDVGGRRLVTKRLAGLSAGDHVVTLGEGARFPPGVYLLRLAQGGRAITRRAVVVR